ncbi:hypothetical protein GCM10010259_05420 [Streptomyces daghestanicus]|uniref:Uncharacterized protein n=1 Tax=Streptomyces daghestanicus TaxID=66885 RepID=A0ABQ3Q923_9ACTN|nr:hypothetical protein GCM10010259_05420 [Streptomyces daghestanicus]GHI33767.1 hypothetical protein Sdagh_54970 [Streptomyces daghestanicus]
MRGEDDQGVEASARRLRLGGLRRRAGTFVGQARQRLGTDVACADGRPECGDQAAGESGRMELADQPYTVFRRPRVDTLSSCVREERADPAPRGSAERAYGYGSGRPALRYGL